MARNPDWTEDEIILALELYVRSNFTVLPIDHPEVIALSEFMYSLPIHPPEVRDGKFRNPSSISTKLANFRYINPAQPGGLSSASKLDYKMWEAYAGDPPRLRRIVGRIHSYANLPELEAEPALTDESAPEGRLLLRVHKIRERNARLVEKRKKQALRKSGSLACEACGFDFLTMYGPIGGGYIECHHTVPVSELTPESKTRLTDLALLCANCHRMVHRSSELLSIERLRKHMKMATASYTGIQLPNGHSIQDGAFALPAATAHPDLWAIAHDLSKLLELELELPGIEPTIPQDQHDMSDIKVWLWIESNFAVGFLCTLPLDPNENFRWLDDVDRGVRNNWQNIDCGYRIVSVWLARNLRGNGIAQNLASTAAAHFGIAIDEYVHSLPLSDAGRRFAKRLSPKGIRVN